MPDYPRRREPRVVLIGGGSGTGKTTLAAALARQRPVRVVAVDDLVAGLSDERLRLPALSSTSASGFGASLFEWLRTKDEVLEPHLRRVVDDALAGGGAVVVEGEGLTPRLMAHYRAAGVGGAVLAEESGARLRTTLTARSHAFQDLDRDRQGAVVEMNTAYNCWMRREATRRGVPAVASQPWETLRDRYTSVVLSPGPAQARPGNNSLRSPNRETR